MMLDDDCIFRHTLKMKDESLKLIESDLPDDWDIVILGNISDEEDIENKNIFYHKCSFHYEAAGSHGIAINNKIYGELQSLFSGSVWLGDGAIGRLINLGKNVYKISPSICHQDRTFFSDINQYFHS
jgi:hypothetical protein